MSVDTTTMPPHKVFEVLELLEHILIQLPEKDLLQVQAVSSKWQHAITTSPNIQEELFFHTKAGHHTHLRLNPLLFTFSDSGISGFTNEMNGLMNVNGEASCHEMLLAQPRPPGPIYGRLRVYSVSVHTTPGANDGMNWEEDRYTQFSVPGSSTFVDVKRAYWAKVKALESTRWVEYKSECGVMLYFGEDPGRDFIMDG